ncbi:MAG TPA: hypothetical protein VGL77_16005 [Armatimonadota bacterium]
MPVAEDNGVWIGVERWHVPTVIRQIAQVVRQIMDGAEISIAHPLGVGAIIAIIIGVLLLLILLAIPLIILFSNSGFG